MHSNQNIDEVLRALERAEDNVPQDWEGMANDENIMFQVMEMDYMLKPLGEHLGISKELFPPPAQLEDDEIKILVDKILDVWDVYNYLAEFPEGLPVRIAYETLLSVWDEIVPGCPVGSFHFDFYHLEWEQSINHKNKNDTKE